MERSIVALALRVAAGFALGLVLVAFSALASAGGSTGVGKVPLEYWPAVRWIFLDLLPHAASMGALFAAAFTALSHVRNPNRLHHDAGML